MDFATMTKERIFAYDAAAFDFQSQVAKILNWYSVEDRDMSLLHTTVPGSEESRVLTLAEDQCLVFHRMYYDSPRLPELLELYHKFVREVCAPMFDDCAVVYQKKPTFRVQLPNNVAVPSDVGGDPAKLGLHCDSQFNHPPGEINFWVPFTDTLPDNTVWLESERGLGDFHPALLGNGQVLQFYGNQVFHHNKINRCGATRVSFDFRVIPLSHWDDSVEMKTTVQSGRTFRIGDGDMDYYTTFDRRTGGQIVFDRNPAESESFSPHTGTAMHTADSESDSFKLPSAVVAAAASVGTLPM